LPRALDPVALLPVATGVACGGSAPDLVPTAAALVLFGTALRILDDLADRDNPAALYHRVGDGRAAHAAAALGSLAITALGRGDHGGSRLATEASSAWVDVCAAQDQELAAPPRSIAAYGRIVARKTLAPYAFSARAGAIAANAAPDQVRRAEGCGRSVGLLVQTLDDIEGLYFPDGPSDLSQGRWTLPVLTALSTPVGASVRKAAAAGDNDRVRTLLDGVGVRRTLMTRALDARDRALEALDEPMLPGGRVMLETWLTWLLRDAVRLAG
jgi:geranylgeranyl diphosphate synthase type I